jgi:hypothetical protein
VEVDRSLLCDRPMKACGITIIVLGVWGVTARWPTYARDIKDLFPIVSAVEAKDPHAKADKSFFRRTRSPEGDQEFAHRGSSRKSAYKAEPDGANVQRGVCGSADCIGEAAKKPGANAIVNVVRYYKRIEMSSPHSVRVP